MLLESAHKDPRFRLEDGEWWYYPPNSHRARAVTGSCRWCGGEFVRTRSGGRSYEFCGTDCYHKWGREQRKEECQRCGKVFVRSEYPRNNEDRRSEGQKYCSHECYAKANKGESHWHYSGYRTRDKRGYEYYTARHPIHPNRPVHSVLWHEVNLDARCEKCGEDVDHVHHRDGDPTNNDLSNLAGLCPGCHIRHHLSHNPSHRVAL